jgi:hypothetical protein
MKWLNRRYNTTGIIAKSVGTTIEKVMPAVLINGLYLGWLMPKVWKALGKPCNK